MTSVIQIAAAESEALQRGDIKEAERLRLLRWQFAMGLIVNSENTGVKPKSKSVVQFEDYGDRGDYGTGAPGEERY